jgi:hypothetical protein
MKTDIGCDLIDALNSLFGVKDAPEVLCRGCLGLEFVAISESN